VSIQIEYIAIAFDRIALKVDFKRRVLGRDWRQLGLGECARVDFGQVIIFQVDRLETMQTVENIWREKLDVIIGQVNFGQERIRFEVTLAKCQFVTRQIKHLFSEKNIFFQL
jgi:hypothetical protein